MCLSDAANGLRGTDLVNAYPSGIHAGARYQIFAPCTDPGRVLSSPKAEFATVGTGSLPFAEVQPWAASFGERA